MKAAFPTSHRPVPQGMAAARVMVLAVMVRAVAVRAAVVRAVAAEVPEAATPTEALMATEVLMATKALMATKSPTAARVTAARLPVVRTQRPVRVGVAVLRVAGTVNRARMPGAQHPGMYKVKRIPLNKLTEFYASYGRHIGTSF